MKSAWAMNICEYQFLEWVRLLHTVSHMKKVPSGSHPTRPHPSHITGLLSQQTKASRNFLYFPFIWLKYPNTVCGRPPLFPEWTLAAVDDTSSNTAPHPHLHHLDLLGQGHLCVYRPRRRRQKNGPCDGPALVLVTGNTLLCRAPGDCSDLIPDKTLRWED